jgi:signal transduction histidine kinase
LLATRIAHDLRNALNAVAVNLEVVRGRSARGAESSAVAPFASTAVAQYEAAAAAAEALLALARPETGDSDVAAIVGHLARLIGVRRESAIRVADDSGGSARTSAPSHLVRAVVARSVLSALDLGDSVACETTVGGGIFLRVTGASHAALPDSELVAVASAYGVRFASRGNVLEIQFPVAGARATPSGPA